MPESYDPPISTQFWYSRLSDTGTTCSRERDGSQCGTYFPITDHIGKPVLMLDGVGNIRGVGEYDPFGNVNRVSFDREWHNVTVNANSSSTAFTINQPNVAGLSEDIRPHILAFDPSCSTNGNIDYPTAKFTTPGYGWNWGTCHLNNYWFPWLPSSDGTAHVSIENGSSQNVTMWGEVVDSYEYRRHTPGVTPFWTPLRYPGQYHDDETDMNQNRNRLYDPLIGQYTGPEPMWQTPGAVLRAAYMGMQAPVYGYAGNNAVNYVDPSGLWGAGLVFGGQAEGGVIGGAGISGQVGAGVFFNNPTTSDPNGPNYWNGFGAFKSWGGFAGKTSPGPSRACSTQNGDRTGVLGGFLGLGPGVFFTNAEHASDFHGPFHTININAGWGWGADISISWDDSGHVFVSGSPEGGGGGSVSTYPTNTSWAWP